MFDFVEILKIISLDALNFALSVQAAVALSPPPCMLTQQQPLRHESVPWSARRAGERSSTSQFVC